MKTANALEIFNRLFVDGNAKMERLIKEEERKAGIAQKIYNLRKARGLTQNQFGKKIGTTGSAISRLEDTDYDWHQSLETLRKIAETFGCDFSVELKESPPFWIEASACSQKHGHFVQSRSYGNWQDNLPKIPRGKAVAANEKLALAA
ncbi:MAG: helix-turn-helix transcriptional regulator [Candidatus Sumerlaeota bacterium]|nr:helix-turn-helix transcriptional regulator [Candidatus Sumerlaeota bacterium]